MKTKTENKTEHGELFQHEYVFLSKTNELQNQKYPRICRSNSIYYNIRATIN